MQVIAGRYQLVDTLGAGGMGTVYGGIDQQTQQSVAVKRLHPALTATLHLQRFLREGEVLRELNHPNIVKLLDVIQQDNEHFLVMEYVAGGDLSDLLAKGLLPIPRILNIALDIADALTRVHRLDIIHRDIKPSNVLLALDGTPRLTDFGIAYLEGEERLTAAGSLIGTVDFLPPEILQGNLVDARADIWAFGVLLFEIIAGQRPFTGALTAQVLKAILFEAVPDLEALRPDAPKALVDLVYRMLEKDRTLRIPSVRLVGAELEALLHGQDSPTAVPLIFTPTLPSSQPRLATNVALASLPKHNLPAQTASFIGREPELDALNALLRDPAVRLVTIIAPGGMGKTSLALETAWRSLRDFTSGVYFVPLASLTAADSILPAVAEAVGYVFREQERTPTQQILEFLGDKDLLLVFDNFEHLIQGSEIVHTLLEPCPNLKMLATSRERLNVGGEHLFELRGLDMPARIQSTNVQNYSAIQLFVQNAHRVQPDFDPAPHFAAILEVCEVVEGMPLAIVLAASWAALLTPPEIAAEVRRSLDFLETDMRNLPERQRSIRAVFEYSWRLLSASERAILMKLALFAGGFTREAAETLAGASLRGLLSLMNKSLINRSRDTGRYTLHSLTRQYSVEKLREAGELDAAARAYSAHYLQMAAALASKLNTRDELAALAVYEAEADNMRAAWQFAVQQGEIARLEPVIEPIIIVYEQKKWHSEGSTLFRAALDALPERTSLLAAELLTGCAAFEFGAASLQPALVIARAALDIVEAHGRNDKLIRPLAVLASILRAQGAFAEGEALERKALDIAHAVQNQAWINTLTVQLGLTIYHQQNYTAIRILLENRLQPLRETASYRTWGMALELLISLTDAQGDRPKARQYVQEMLTISKETQFWSRVSAAYSWLAVLDAQDNDYASAQQNAQKSLEVALAAEDRYLVATAAGELGFLAALRGDVGVARRHLRVGLEHGTSIIAKRRAFTPLPFIALASGQPDRALEYAALLLSQPNLEIIVKRVLEPLDARLKAQFPEEIYQAVWARGAARDFDAVCRDILNDLQRSAAKAS